MQGQVEGVIGAGCQQRLRWRLRLVAHQAAFEVMHVKAAFGEQESRHRAARAGVAIDHVGQFGIEPAGVHAQGIERIVDAALDAVALVLFGETHVQPHRRFGGEYGLAFLVGHTAQ